MRKNRQATEKDDSKPDNAVKHHEADNVKQTNNTRKSVPPAATIGHLPSFSSLFTNNPDIPSRGWFLGTDYEKITRMFPG